LPCAADDLALEYGYRQVDTSKFVSSKYGTGTMRVS